MKYFVRLGALIALFVVGSASSQSTAAPAALEDRWLNGSAGYARAVELQRELNVPLVVYFYTDWCPYCRRLDADYLPSVPVQNYLRGVVKVRINPEHGRPERELANRFGVNGYPKFLVMRTASARPVELSPFRLSGANWTTTQFANACRQAAPGSRRATGQSNSSQATERDSPLSTGSVKRAAPENAKAQVVTVAPVEPEFIADDSPPTIDQVLGKYVDALGGKAAQMRLHSRVTRGRVDVVGVSNGGRLESYAIAPNKTLLVMEIDRVGVMRQGFDGKNGWEQSDQSGLRASTGLALQSLARDAEFYHDLKLKELYASVKVLGKVKHSSREVYLVEARPRMGEAELLYFDTLSGLLVRRDVTRQTSHGAVRAEIYLSDWQTVDGVKIPFKITQLMPDQTFVFTLQEVKHNVSVDQTMFQKPALAKLGQHGYGDQ